MERKKFFCTKNQFSRTDISDSSNYFLLEEVQERLIPRIFEFKIFSSIGLKILLIGNYSKGIFLQLSKYIDVSENFIVSVSENKEKNFIPGINFITSSILNNCFKNESFDLVISLGNMHLVDNIEKYLSNIYKIMKKNSLFLGNFMGGGTLKELRVSLNEAEMNLYNRFVPRIAPFVDIKDAGRLLQVSGFKDVLSDNFFVSVKYRDIQHLIHDLRNMGQSGILANKNINLSRGLLELSNAYYKKNFFLADGIEANFEFIGVMGVK